MELNSTQESAANPVASIIPVESPVAIEPSAAIDKKTTIQLFASTTKRLTSRKKGNDTYDDVINRDLDTLEKAGQ